MQFKRRHKIVAALALSCTSATGVVGGALVLFNDPGAEADRPAIKASAAEVTLTEDAQWSNSLGNLGIGDTVPRTVTVDNISPRPVKAMHLTVNLADQPSRLGGALSEATTVTIRQGGHVLADHVLMSRLRDGYDLVFPPSGLGGHDEVRLSFNYDVVGAPASEPGNRFAGSNESAANPDNKYQGASLVVTYTIDAVQRVGQGQGDWGQEN